MTTDASEEGAAELRAAPGTAGPVVGEAADTECAWADVLAPLEAAAAARPGLARWVRQLRDTGFLRQLAGDPPDGRQLVDDALRVLHALPADGLQLARLATQCVGGAHALDAGTPLDALVLGAIHSLAGDPMLDGPEGRRESYASFGVLVDEFASQVLVLNVRARGGTPTDRILKAGAWYGEPVVLTLGHLSRYPPELPALDGQDVFVCETVEVFTQAASRLGRSAAPLVCIQGRPTVAAMRLLGRLSRAGARLRYHGSFSWQGLELANHVLANTGAHAWRYGAEDYRRAHVLHAAPLSGEPVDASWEPELRPAMSALGVAVEEDSVVDVLLQDLRRP